MISEKDPALAGSFLVSYDESTESIVCSVRTEISARICTFKSSSMRRSWKRAQSLQITGTSN
jgi:hypothetical protein